MGSVVMAFGGLFHIDAGSRLAMCQDGDDHEIYRSYNPKIADFGPVIGLWDDWVYLAHEILIEDAKRSVE